MDSETRNAIDALKQRVTKLEAKYDHIDSLLDDISKIVSKIDSSLTGDDYSSGWFLQIRQNKDRSEENQQRLNQIKYWAGGASAGAIIVTEIVMKFFGL